MGANSKVFIVSSWVHWSIGEFGLLKISLLFTDNNMVKPFLKIHCSVYEISFYVASNYVELSLSFMDILKLI